MGKEGLPLQNGAELCGVLGQGAARTPLQPLSWHPILVPFPTPLLPPVQEWLRHIGPEEFVQAFVNKDPLASTKVEGSWVDCPSSDPCSLTRIPGASAEPAWEGPRAEQIGLEGPCWLHPSP